MKDAHNPEVGGSNPPPAIKDSRPQRAAVFNRAPARRDGLLITSSTAQIRCELPLEFRKKRHFLIVHRGSDPGGRRFESFTVYYYRHCKASHYGLTFDKGTPLQLARRIHRQPGNNSNYLRNLEVGNRELIATTFTRQAVIRPQVRRCVEVDPEIAWPIG